MRFYSTSILLSIGLQINIALPGDLEQGWTAFYQGRYASAVESFEKAASDPQFRIEAIVGQSLALQEMTKYGKSRRLLRETLARQPDARLAYRLGRLELFLGDQTQARKYFEEALQISPRHRPAQLHLAILKWHHGERAEATRTFADFLDFYRTAPELTAEEIVLVARACIYLERFQDANRLFSEATKKEPRNWTLFIPWGELFLEKYNSADALAIFADALKRNPNCAPALLGLARAQASTNLEAALATAKRALALSPNSPRARTVAAELFLAANLEEEAAEQLAAVVTKHRFYLPAYALQAVLADRRQDSNALAKIVDRAAALNPKDASIWVRLGEDAARRYLFKESVDYFRRAVATDEQNWQAHAGLGTSLSRLGLEREAKDHLDLAFQHDSYNVLSRNLLNLFDELADYDTVRTAHFLIRLQPEDKAVIGLQAAELCEAAYESMVPRYRVELANPTLVEIFPRHDDFAVRCFGLPGAQVFLGICFGRLIAMDSPRARDKGTFNWQETLWHEFAHVVHLQLTANRIPRWLAEGLAVFEATHARSEWNMNLELAMIRALRANELLPLSELDRAFARRPDLVSLVYYQASQIVEFVNERYGFEKVLALLPLYRQGQKSDTVVRTVFGLSVDEFDQQFREYLRTRFAPEKVEVEWAHPDLLNPRASQTIFRRLAQGDEGDGISNKLRQFARDEPNNFFAVLSYGRYLAETGETGEAEKYLRQAKSLLPSYVESGNPYSVLADLYWRQGRSQEAVSELEFLTAKNGKALIEAVQLSQWQLALEDTAAAARALSRALAIYPYDADHLRQLGQFWLALKRPRRAVMTFKALLGLRPADRAGAHCLLAEAYLAAGDRRLAKKQALAALEIAPSFERAQEILLQSVE